MVTSEALDGVPILVLANKQDVEVSLPLCLSSRSSRGPTSLGLCLPWAHTALPAVQGAFSPLGGSRALSCSLETQGMLEEALDRKERDPRVGLSAAPILSAALRVGSGASPSRRTRGVWGGTETVPWTTNQSRPSVEGHLRSALPILPTCLRTGLGREGPAPHSLPLTQTCLSIPDIKTAFSDCTSKIGRRDCLTQACSALTG